MKAIIVVGILMAISFTNIPAASFASEEYVAIVSTYDRCAQYKEPSLDSPIEGYLLLGTKMRATAIDDEWYYANTSGGPSGYVLANDIDILTEKRIGLIGIPEIGYCVVNYKDYPRNTRSLLYHFPDVESQQFSGEALLTGECRRIISCLDEWCQVQGSTDASLAFQESKFLDIYLRGDLIVEEDLYFRLGVYKVDVDMPSGLYTFFASQESEGTIQVTGTNSAHDTTYVIPPGFQYTIYVPPKATVHILSDGELRAMENSPIVNEDNNWTFAGDGRFFIGFETLPLDTFLDIAKVDDSKPAYYTITNLSNVYHYDFEPQTIFLTTGGYQSAGITRGCFIEMVNCVVRAAYPSG